MPACPSCGRENSDDARFCRAGATPLAAPEPAREQRKVVTVLFCDLVGSTALGESTDPEALRARMRRYFDDLRAIIERHGGMVEKFVGDAVMAVFGIPVSHEDDALRAVRAAAEMGAAVRGRGGAEPISLKGKAEPVEAFRLLEVLDDADALIRHLEAPLVGRERER